MLNPAQEKAVKTVQGRVLVLAGAGTGKTRVIVQRIAHLIRNLEVSPESILGLTFTNKAATEMKERVAALIGHEAGSQVTLSTFHSFCMQILRKEIEHLGYTRHFSLYDERDLDRLIGQIARDLLGCDGELPSLGPTKAALADAANKGHASDKGHTWHDQFSKEIYTRLQSMLRAHNAVSFDNLITLTIRLFESHPAILEKYQERYRYIMIDEYQDTNPAQFRLADLLASKYNNLCVVGDDDQSIYGWRGAEVSHILHFKNDCIIKLEQNYRSTPNILHAANSLIQNNKTRHGKNLWSAAASGNPIEVFNAPSDVEEAQAVINRILYLKQEHKVRWKEIAILYRSNALSRQFEMALINASWQKKEGEWVRGIPYEIFGGLEFSERSEIKDLLSYMRVIANPLDQEALLRIINVPRRGISDTFLDELTQQHRSKGTSLWALLEEIEQGKHHYPHHPRGVAGIRSFVNLMKKAQKRFESDLASALTWLLEEIDYKKAIEEEVKSDKMRAFKWENAQECVNALAQFEKEAPPQENSLQDFVSNTALGRPTFANVKQSEGDQIQLMTLHSAKGLEFPICFIVGLEDHILPHEKSMMQTSLEEERRLFYVGITRARKKLILSMARSRMRMGKMEPTQPSRFLFEIPKQSLKVVHAKDMPSYGDPPPSA